MLIKINKSIFNVQQRRGTFVFHGKMPRSKNFPSFPLAVVSQAWLSDVRDTHSPIIDTSYLDCLPQYMYKYVYINLHSLKVVEAGLILSSCLASREKMILSEKRCFNIHRVIKLSDLPQSSKKNKSTSHHKYSKNWKQCTQTWYPNNCTKNSRAKMNFYIKLLLYTKL